MNMNFIYKVILVVLVIIVALFALRSCQRTKDVEIKQKSTDRKTQFSVDIEREKVKK